MIELPFDKIYCLHCAEDKDRLEHFMNEMKKIGLEDKVEIWWTCHRGVSHKVGELLTEMHDDQYDWIKMKHANSTNIYAGVFNCALEHYTIAKQAYLRGFKSILIFEDDIKLVDNIELIESTFRCMPIDYDILKFYDVEGHAVEGWYDESPDTKKQTWKKVIHFGHSTAFWALSNSGMKKYCDMLDKKFVAADKVVLELSDEPIKAYRVGSRIAYGWDKHTGFKSTIECYADGDEARPTDIDEE